MAGLPPSALNTAGLSALFTPIVGERYELADRLLAAAIAGTFSTTAFAILASVGVAMTGNPGAAALGLAGSLIGAGIAVALVMSLRPAGFRAWLVTLTDRAMRLVRRGTRGRPRRDVGALLRGMLEQAGGWGKPSRARWPTGWQTWAAGVGIHVPVAVTVTLLYRLLSFKVGMSVVWFGYHSWRRRRAAA
jgi:hypothetical protein